MDLRSNEPALVFGPFELRRAEKLLLENGSAVRLGSRALEILCVLVERAGDIVTRDELVAKVWPRTVVEDTSLRVHVSALRKALGDGQHGARYITNVPGRGYGFVAPVTLKAPLLPLFAQADSAELRHNLPLRLTRTLGRSELVTSLSHQLAQRRLVSIVGPGGMGKTTVALAVAQESLSSYIDGVRFVDLAPLDSAAQVPAALGAVVGITVPEDRPWQALADCLCHSRMLIVLDNCEHVIAAAATLSECLLRAAPGVCILATSREALNAEGEWVHRLAPLAMPEVDEVLTGETVMSYPAAQLFVERATANSDSFRLTEQNLLIVGQLCRQLEGMPLAIELAAGRIDTLGLQGLAAHMDDLFRILMTGRRTALPRHRTLHALLDWSHALLPALERTVLRRLSVFRAGFTLESASMVAADEDLSLKEVTEGVFSLCAKSLVTVDIGVDVPRYRLLYTTRLYAARKLAEQGELNAVSRRHALCVRDLARACIAQGGAQLTPAGTAPYRQIMEDARAAFDWAISVDGEEAVGVAIISETLELRFSVGRLDEFRVQVEQALDRVARLEPPQAELELRLSTAWCYLSGQSPPQERRQADIFARTSLLCESVGGQQDRIHARHSMLVGAFGQGRYADVCAGVEQLRLLATGRWASVDLILCDRFLLMAQHFLGDHGSAKLLIERVFNFEASGNDRWFVGHVPPAVSMRAMRSRIHWLEGQPDRAMQLALEAVDLAQGRHPFAMCQALGMAAIPIALWRGDDLLARLLIDQLLTHARPLALAYWQSFAHSFARVLELRGQAPASREGPAPSSWRLPTNAMELDLLATLSEELISFESVSRVASGAVGWNAPEVIRANACARLAVGAISAREAEAAMVRALHLARKQGARAWELRAASSLARLWGTQDRAEEAAELLSDVLGRFEEGASTRDLLSARALLDELVDTNAQRRRKRG